MIISLPLISAEPPLTVAEPPESVIFAAFVMSGAAISSISFDISPPPPATAVSSEPPEPQAPSVNTSITAQSINDMILYDFFMAFASFGFLDRILTPKLKARLKKELKFPLGRL